MFRPQEYATFCGGGQPIASSRLRLVEPYRRTEDHRGAQSCVAHSHDAHSHDAQSRDGGRPGLIGLPAVSNPAERVSDRTGRGTAPVTTSAMDELSHQLFRHLTRHLGSVSGAWSRDPADADLGFQVVEFAPGRIDDAVIYSTLGLSDYILDSAITDGRFRLELIMIAPERLRGSALPYVLGDYGRMVLALRELPEIGAIVRNVPILSDLSTMDALYLGRPRQFPPDFARFRSGDLAVNIDWLLPVSAAEATFVDAEGWAAFEKLINNRDDFDPIDFGRSSMPL